MNFLAFDLETTGLDIAQDRIIEIAIYRGGEPEPVFETLVNPGIPIPPKVTELTRITDLMVKDAKTFGQIAEYVGGLLEGQVVVGYGINRFDIAVLCEEMLRAGTAFDFRSVTWIDVGELYKVLAPRNLSAAVREFLERDHVGAHGAGPDAAATAEIFATMLRRNPKLASKSPAEIATESRYGNAIADPAGKLTYIDGRLCFNFGKSKGVPVVDDVGFARWMLDRDFPLATKRVLEDELNAEAEAEVESALPGQSTIPW